jgi:hypothetical protein
MSEKNTRHGWQFPDQDCLWLQKSSVRWKKWILREVWYNLEILMCSLSIYWINWVCHTPGKGMEWVGATNPIGDSTYYTNLLKDRFIISRDNAKSQLYLQINSLKLRTQPCISVQKTQWRDFSVSPDTKLPSGTLSTSRRYARHSGVTQHTSISGKPQFRCRHGSRTGLLNVLAVSPSDSFPLKI